LARLWTASSQVGTQPPLGCSATQPEEIIGKSILLLIPPERHDEEVGILRGLSTGKRIEHFETERITKNGDRIDVSLTISPIKDSTGKVIGASKIVRDITERKRMQEALRNSERQAAMGRVAAVLAHEINNPLEALTNTFYLLQKHPSLDKEGRELTRIANVEMRRLGHIAKQTLGLYRQSSNLTSLSIRALLDEILEVYGIETLTIKFLCCHVTVRYTRTSIPSVLQTR
jgi:signal transduction histidine kinase